MFVGDVLTTGVYAASLVGADPEEAIAILGAGPVGFCIAQALLAMGAGRVYALDRDPARLALIATTGATPVDVGTTNPEMVLARATAGRGADVVVDAVGAPDAYELSARTSFAAAAASSSSACTRPRPSNCSSAWRGSAGSTSASRGKPRCTRGGTVRWTDSSRANSIRPR